MGVTSTDTEVGESSGPSTQEQPANKEANISESQPHTSENELCEERDDTVAEPASSPTKDMDVKEDMDSKQEGLDSESPLTSRLLQGEQEPLEHNGQQQQSQKEPQQEADEEKDQQQQQQQQQQEQQQQQQEEDNDTRYEMEPECSEPLVSKPGTRGCRCRKVLLCGIGLSTFVVGLVLVVISVVLLNNRCTEVGSTL